MPEGLGGGVLSGIICNLKAADFISFDDNLVGMSLINTWTRLKPGAREHGVQSRYLI